MKISILNGKFAQLVDCDEKLSNKIRYVLSYIPPGMAFSPAGRNGWDGRVFLMDKKNIFALGLVTTVKNYLDSKSIPYTVEDCRGPLSKGKPIDIITTLKEMNREPRWYQTLAVDKVLENAKGVIKAPTGSGKSQIAAMSVAALGKKSIIFVIGKDLLHQFHSDFEKIFKTKIGIIGDGICDIQEINIVSIWTAGQALKLKKKDLASDDGEEMESENYDDRNDVKILKLLKETRVAQLDECHICSCQTLKSIYNVLDSIEHLYGLSGTPFKMDETDIVTRSILGDTIVDISISSLIKEETLARPIIKFLSVPKMPMVGETYPEVYSNYIINNDIRNQMVVDNTKLLVSKGYQVLVLFNNINHGKILNDLFIKEDDIVFEMLSGKDNNMKRDIVKDKAKNKEINCILASKIFNIGVDIPSLSALVLAGSGKALVATYQKIGRVVRKYPGKKVAAIIDFLDNAKYLKQHSKRRYELYSMEPEFKLIGVTP